MRFPGPQGCLGKSWPRTRVGGRVVWLTFIKNGPIAARFVSQITVFPTAAAYTDGGAGRWAMTLLEPPPIIVRQWSAEAF